MLREACSLPEALAVCGPSVFQQTHLQEEPLWDKCQAFDLLRKPLYCLLQKCPEAEAASFPSWGFKHMMAILSIFSPFKFLFILVIWDRREGSTWMATTRHSLSNRLSRRIFPPIVSFLLGIKTFFFTHSVSDHFAALFWNFTLLALLSLRQRWSKQP